MEIRFVKKVEWDNKADATVYAFYEDALAIGEGVDASVAEMIQHLFDTETFKGKPGQLQSFKVATSKNPNKIILVGLGKKSELKFEDLRKAVAKGVKEAENLKAKALEVGLLGISDKISTQESARIVGEIALLASYKFDKYFSTKKESSLKHVYIVDESCEASQGLDEGIALGQATRVARDLVNEPANVLTPIELAKRAQVVGEAAGFEVEVYDEDKVAELEMRAFLEVARAADNPPRLIVMRYRGDDDNPKEILGLVGKGLTYDSGGLSLKSKQGMITMKCDMGGAASVIGAMQAIAEQGLKLNVVAVVAACENMVSGKSYRPGDIIGSMADKSIFIGSTDAEGRLTLVDAVHYVIEHEGATRIVDIATLTGAAVATLGNVASPVITNDDDFYNQLEAAAQLAGEKFWRMPTFDEYKASLKSPVADLTNSAGPPGTITAGLFIGEFVQSKPWLHLDIAGTAFSIKESEYAPIGATGFGVRSLYYLAKGLAK